MDMHKEYTAWAYERGVELRGISAHRFPGRGLGIRADRMIEAGEEIIKVASRGVRTELTVPKDILKPLKKISVNGLLAAELTLDKSERNAIWRAVLPTKADFAESMPLLWQPALQALLPPVALALLEKQKKRLSLDWPVVSATFPTISYDDYLYNWLLVSTRTFFFTSPKVKRRPLARDDCLALLPLADLFNHADVGCEVSYAPSTTYTIVAHREIQAGEEVFISYGNHSNDFLLVEYGFILADNRWDEASLDAAIIPRLTEEQREALDEEGYLGKYMVDGDTVCYRTLTVLKLLRIPINKWKRALLVDKEGGNEEHMDGVLLQVLKSSRDGAERKIMEVSRLDVGLESQRATLLRRWRQIHKLICGAVDRMERKALLL